MSGTKLVYEKPTTKNLNDIEVIEINDCDDIFLTTNQIENEINNKVAFFFFFVFLK